MTPRIDDADFENSTHAKAIVEIIDSYAKEAGGQGEPLSEWSREHLVEGLAGHPSAMVLLAFLDDRPVGVVVCMLNFSTFAARPSINVHDLAVLSSCRGQGVGHALLAEVERRARERGCAKITLEVHDSNHGAKRLYRSLGFGPWEPATFFVSKPLT